MSQIGGCIFLGFKSSRPSYIKPLTACLYKPFKRYSQEASKEENISSSLHHERHERAPSTADEFERVAEERLRAAERDQGVASQTSEKVGDSKVDSVKDRFKEHGGGADYSKRGDEDV